MKKIRVAYLMLGIYYGGATRSLQLLIKSLEGVSVENFIFTINTRSKEITEDLKKSVEVLEIVRLKTISNNEVFYEKYSEAVKKINAPISDLIFFLKKHQIDILHINNSVFSHIPRKVKSELPKVKVITHIRELIPKYDDGKLQKYLIEEITEYSDKIICISHIEQQYFMHTSKAIVIQNPFDFSLLSSLKPLLRLEYGIDKSTILVGMISHFSENKGHLDFIKAMPLLKEKLNKYNFKFIIIGVKKTSLIKRIIKDFLIKNNFEKKISRLIEKNELRDDIILVPYTNKPLNYIADLDILVRPSLHADPYGRDIIEAMALKKPIVATGTLELFVEDGVTGFLIPPGSPEAIAEKVMDFIKDTEMRKEFGKRGYERIKNMCDLQEYGKKIYNIYSELIS